MEGGGGGVVEYSVTLVCRCTSTDGIGMCTSIGIYEYRLLPSAR